MQLARFYGWGPEEAWRVTGSELLEWCQRANAMIEAAGRK